MTMRRRQPKYRPMRQAPLSQREIDIREIEAALHFLRSGRDPIWAGLRGAVDRLEQASRADGEAGR